MLSPAGFDLAWTQYQRHLVNELNRLTSGTKDGDRATKDVLLAHARTPSKAATFNYASMAWNTHQTMTTLSPTPAPISTSLAKRIENAFSSVDSLRAHFLATANAMFGPGFVWLIKNNNAREGNPANDPQLSILATYIAGSPLHGAHFRRQPIDLNTENPATAYNTTDNDADPNRPNWDGSPSQLRTTAGAFGSASGSLDSKLGLGGAYLEVMLGVCTWPHFYTHDFGVGGKSEYLKAWWDSVDWNVVERNGLFNSGEGTGARFDLRTRRYAVR